MKKFKNIALVMLMVLLCTQITGQVTDSSETRSETVVLFFEEMREQLPVATIVTNEADLSECSATQCAADAGSIIFLYLDGKQKITIPKRILKKQKECTLEGVSMCNASVVKVKGKKYLCTAHHCGATMFSGAIQVGQDAALLKPSVIKPNQISGGYDMAYMENDLDFLWIVGFIPLDDQTIQKVTICGLARRDPTKTWAFIKMDDIHELYGLSGSPVFNKNGDIVGIYSGWIPNDAVDPCYSLVSLFKE